MPTTLDNIVKSRHQPLKPFTYGQGQTAKKGDVLDTSKWSSLAVHRMMKQGFLLVVPTSTVVKESDPYGGQKVAKLKEDPKAEAKVEEPKSEEPKTEEPTAAKKGSSKKKKGD